MNCRIFHEFSVRAPESRFERRLHTHVKANFVFRLFNVSLSFRAQSAKKTCLRFAIFNLIQFPWQNIFEIHVGLKKYGVFVQKSLSLKKYFERKNSRTTVCCLCVNLPIVKIWGLSDKFPMSFSFLVSASLK